MLIFNTVSEVNAFVSKAKSNGKSIGFVPTMGALHKGHLSLVDSSVNDNDITIASVFVNPTQFNDAKDLEHYPRTFEQDKALLERAGCTAVFYPDVEEMYPEKDERQFNFDGIETRMEGEHRPGHFNGVAQVVSKLFYAIPANKAYFGLKDFQQVTIIKHLVKQLNLETQIIACDIIREANGLAMSSRNERLTKSQRQQAGIIYEQLKLVKDNAKNMSLSDLNQKVIKNINASGLFQVEYFEIVNSSTLLPVINKDEHSEVIACIAVWADKVRLIDNIIINF